MTWQGKYEFKADSNPPPGFYDPNDSQIRTSSPFAKMTLEKKKDSTAELKSQPGPGQYTGHLKKFGAKMNNINFGSKHNFKPD